MIEPQQALFTAVREKLLEAYPDRVYDGAIPGPETPYPFIYLGEFGQNDTETKSVIIGSIPVTVHVWHCRPDQRGTVSAMCLAVKTAIREAAHGDYSFQARNVGSRIVPDNTTTTPLLHGIVEAEVRFMPKH
ncbi:MAG: DUF3168 domain-containing protein [Lachnospiraceae bacterium]|nr:DUF3168 domain-containing protein [Lachnospiraceae bacterium]